MRPTVRGVAVALVAAAAIVSAATAGPRALNAVAAPALVALGAAALQVGLADPPTVDRADPEPGVPGETRTVEASVDGSGLVRVVDSLPEGVTGDAEARTALPGTVSYELTFDARGVWTVGPPRVVVSDVFGLFVRTVDSEATATVVVYPPVVDLPADRTFTALFGTDRAPRRRAFEGVREYVPGDPLRDVHWKSSAKREDLVVKEFTGDRQSGSVTVVASAEAGHADAMATAAASIADRTLSAGLSVGVVCPGGEVPPSRSGGQRTRLLETLARTGAGAVDDAREDADVLVHADADGVTLTVDGQSEPVVLREVEQPATGEDEGETTEVAG